MLATTKTWVVTGILAALASPVFAVPSVTFDLQNAQVSGTNATVEVHVNFTSDNAADTLDGIQLSVLASDPALQTPDYNRFSFVGTSGWSTIFDFADLSLGVAAIAPDTLPGPLAGSNFLLGTLSVDLSGLSTGQSYLVDLTGGVFDPDRTSTYAVATLHTASNPDGVLTDVEGSFATGSVSFTPEAVPGGVIPEPATVGLGALALAGIAAATMRRRRD